VDKQVIGRLWNASSMFSSNDSIMAKVSMFRTSFPLLIFTSTSRHFSKRWTSETSCYSW